MKSDALHIHIVTTDETAGVLCSELERIGVHASWGSVPAPGAWYHVEPTAPNADALTADALVRVYRNLQTDGLASYRNAEFSMRATGAGPRRRAPR